MILEPKRMVQKQANRFSTIQYSHLSWYMISLRPFMPVFSICNEKDILILAPMCFVVFLESLIHSYPLAVQIAKHNQKPPANVWLQDGSKESVLENLFRTTINVFSNASNHIRGLQRTYLDLVRDLPKSPHSEIVINTCRGVYYEIPQIFNYHDKICIPTIQNILKALQSVYHHRDDDDDVDDDVDVDVDDETKECTEQQNYQGQEQTQFKKKEETQADTNVEYEYPTTTTTTTPDGENNIENAYLTTQVLIEKMKTPIQKLGFQGQPSKNRKLFLEMFLQSPSCVRPEYHQSDVPFCFSIQTCCLCADMCMLNCSITFDKNDRNAPVLITPIIPEKK
jgi:hypothetical protein